ncbi:hypothetical protein HK099_002024, partial [Clydaea vesicula]
AGLRTELRTEVAGLRTELRTEVAGLKTELRTEVAGLKTEVAGLRADVKKNINDLCKFKKECTNNFKTILDSIGSVYEIVARHELIKDYGEHYARPFRMQDMHGVARLILPKRPFLQSEKIDITTNTTEILNDRSNSLIASIVDNDHEFKKSLNLAFSSISRKHSKRSWVQDLKKIFTGYETLKVISEKVTYLKRKNGLAVAFITSTFIINPSKWADENDIPLRSCLELDIRGSCGMMNSNGVDIEVGEIKSNEKNDTKGSRQLAIALCTLAYSVNVLKLTANLKGILYSPDKSKNYFENEDELVWPDNFVKKVSFPDINEIWFQLVDSEGNPYNKTSPSTVLVQQDTNINVLRKLIKVEYPNTLLHIDAGQLEIYESVAKLRDNSPINPKTLVLKLDNTEDLVVVVPENLLKRVKKDNQEDIDSLDQVKLFIHNEIAEEKTVFKKSSSFDNIDIDGIGKSL